MSCQCSQAPGGAGGDAGNGMFWRMDAARGGEVGSSESGLDPSAGGRAARCGAAGKDLDNDHAAAAARAWRTMRPPQAAGLSALRVTPPRALFRSLPLAPRYARTN